MAAVHALNPQRRARQPNHPRLNTAAVAEKVAPPQRLEYEGCAPALDLRKTPMRLRFHQPLPIQLATQMPPVHRLQQLLLLRQYVYFCTSKASKEARRLLSAAA
jgi:hypothetical protein